MLMNKLAMAGVRRSKAGLKMVQFGFAMGTLL